MYRKIAFASLSLNVAFVLLTLFAFVPWILNIAKYQKTEMPMLLMWLLNISHFVTNPQSIVPTLAILLVGFFALKALRRRTPANL